MESTWQFDLPMPQMIIGWKSNGKLYHEIAPYVEFEDIKRDNHNP